MITLRIDWCARNRFLVFTGTLLLLLAGLWSMRRIPLDALPDISDVQVIIHTAWNEPPNIIEDHGKCQGPLNSCSICDKEFTNDAGILRRVFGADVECRYADGNGLHFFSARPAGQQALSRRLLACDDSVRGAFAA
jgi:hypothetical protein